MFYTGSGGIGFAQSPLNGSGIGKSPLSAVCPFFSELSLTVMITHGFDSDPVRWQIVTLSFSAKAGMAITAPSANETEKAAIFL